MISSPALRFCGEREGRDHGSSDTRSELLGSRRLLPACRACGTLWNSGETGIMARGESSANHGWPHTTRTVT
eukprot:2048799-Prymnesium_polylepis.2